MPKRSLFETLKQLDKLHDKLLFRNKNRSAAKMLEDSNTSGNLMTQSIRLKERADPNWTDNTSRILHDCEKSFWGTGTPIPKVTKLCREEVAKFRQNGLNKLQNQIELDPVLYADDDNMYVLRYARELLNGD